MKTQSRPAREKLVAAATRLFYSRGIHAVGIDEIVERAGIAKMSLYNNFASKDELVCEYLRRQSGALLKTFSDGIDGARSARDNLLGIFDTLSAILLAPDFRGCPFTRAAGELSGLRPRHPGLDVCAEHKGRFRAMIRDLAGAASAPEPDALAVRLAVLVDGALAQGALTEPSLVAREARGAAAQLIEAALHRAP
jgi:AcrR family transcriptional regulator